MPVRRLAIFLCVLASWQTGAAVTPDMQKAIRTATFEVVRKKPEHDPLEYEKPLPLELLPYTERNDAYQSIGTAFALGNNTYVTAAHVLLAGINSQYGPPSLRASDGTVYSIDKITKFSDFRDFAVFSLAGDPKPVGFAINRTPRVDDPVLAVGDALGEGIVIRDGLFTSETPEDQDGRWKWIRFSAAASPGNSGGPLLDANGKVIGIVIGKSPNENLNYSLPIREMLDSPEGTAQFDQRVVTRFPVLHNTRTFAYRHEFKLPLSWPEFAKAYEEVVVRYSKQARDELLKANEHRIFPSGEGTEELLFDLDVHFEPRIIAQQTDNTWSAVAPGYRQADLPGDGQVSVADVSGTGITLLRLHRPHNADDEAFYSNSKTFMDLALKGMNITRTVGADNVRVISMGAAAGDTVYTDHHGRRWQQRLWPLPYLDAWIISMQLPTPDGYVALLQYAPSALERIAQSQVALMADFVDVSYSGTLAQWQSFLKRRALLPASLADLTLNTDKDLTLHTKRFTFKVPSTVMPVNAHSELDLGMGFIRNDDHVVWDVGSVNLYRDPQHKSYVQLHRQKQPPATARQELRNQFSNMQSRRSPYDMQSSREQDDTYSVTGVLDAPGKTVGKISPDLVYSVTLALEGVPGTTDLATKEQILLKSMQILERGEAPEIDPPKRGDSDDLEKSIARTRQWIHDMEKYADAFSAVFGKDSRGRTYAQDVREFVAEPIEKLVDDMNTLSTEQYEIWQAASEHAKVLLEYWQQVGRINSSRDVWPAFLKMNRLSETTEHGESVKALEAQLMTLVAGSPSSTWAKQANELADAYLQEREQILRGLAPPDGPFIPRQSACPAPSDKTSGKAWPTLAPTSKPPSLNYPPMSRRNGHEGMIMLLIQIDEAGCAIDARVIGSSGYEELDAAAMTLYESMQFLPAEKNGKAVATTVSVPIIYRLKD